MSDLSGVERMKIVSCRMTICNAHKSNSIFFVNSLLIGIILSKFALHERTSDYEDLTNIFGNDIVQFLC